MLLILVVIREIECVLEDVVGFDPLDACHEVDVGPEDEEDGIHQQVVHACNGTEELLELDYFALMLHFEPIVSEDETGDALILDFILWDLYPVSVVQTER